MCEHCKHVQLMDVVDPAVLFENYVYVSGTAPSFVEHFKHYAEQCIATEHMHAGDFVVDIGSNDGTLLRFFKEAEMTVLGIDPAKDIARQATENGIPTTTAFFSAGLARDIRTKHGPAKLITANNVFAHTDTMRDFTKGIAALLADDGAFVFEVSYLADVVTKKLFDTIYHEHLAYHSVKPLMSFFEEYGLRIVRAKRVQTHGGSLRCTIKKAASNPAIDASVEKRIKEEESLGLDRPETFLAFAQDINAIGNELRTIIDEAKKKGRTIAGFGAPAKATTLMYHFGIGPETVEFIVDDSPLKQNLFTPGKHVPVLPSTALYEQCPDDVIILAWNFATPIMNNHQKFTAQGGRFIVPLPEVKAM